MDFVLLASLAASVQVGISEDEHKNCIRYIVLELGKVQCSEQEDLRTYMEGIRGTQQLRTRIPTKEERETQLDARNL